jgi:hypothetical protein
MKLTKELLAQALKPAADILRAKASSDVPRYLKLEAANGRFKISANDQNQSSVTEVDCEGDLKPVCVTLGSIQTILPLFGESVTIEMSGANLKIRSQGTFLLNTFSANEFPTIPTDKMPKVGVNCSDLADCMDKVKFASRKEDSRTNLYGVCIKLSPKKIVTMAATGIIFAKIEKAAIAPACEILVPYPFVANLVSSLRNVGAVLCCSSNRVKVEFDGGMYECGLFDAKFPAMLENLETAKRTGIGSFKPVEWLPVFRSIFSMAGEEGKLRSDVIIDGGCLEHKGAGGSVNVKIDKLTRKLNLNASTFIECLEAFGDDECKAFVTADGALILEKGDLMVATTQLRGV